MRCLIWSSWVKQPVGGQERIALELALRLHERGHRIVLVGAYDNAPLLRARIPADLPYVYFDLHRRPKPHWAALRLLGQLADEHRVELISGHGNIFAAAEVSRRRALPFVWTVHGVRADRPTLGLEQLKALALRRVLRHPLTHVVGVSAATVENLGQRYPFVEPTRLHTIHNGVVEEATVREVTAADAGPPWQLGFVGRVVARKRPLDLVALAKQLGDRLDYRIHVFGDGPLLPVLRGMVTSERLDARFMFHGYWTQGCASMMDQLHLLVNPDEMEPFGGAVLEAQLAARPVVAYRVGGNPEIVEHSETGWLATLGDTQALAAGVLAIAGPDYQAYTTAARQRAQTRFSLARMVDSYERLFTDVGAANSIEPREQAA